MEGVFYSLSPLLCGLKYKPLKFVSPNVCLYCPNDVLYIFDLGILLLVRRI